MTVIAYIDQTLVTYIIDKGVLRIGSRLVFYVNEEQITILLTQLEAINP